MVHQFTRWLQDLPTDADTLTNLLAGAGQRSKRLAAPFSTWQDEFEHPKPSNEKSPYFEPTAHQACIGRFDFTQLASCVQPLWRMRVGGLLMQMVLCTRARGWLFSGRGCLQRGLIG